MYLRSVQYIVVLCFITVNNLFAQGWNIPQVHPPTSEAFNKSILSEQSTQPSGQFNYSVPIYNLALKNIAIPISLDYTSGIKVNNIGGSVGTSWNLNTGGIITRTVRDKIDENSTKYLPNYEDLKTKKDDEWKKLTNHELTDSEYDLFNFSLPNGINGEFFIEKDLKIIYNGKDNLKITAKWVNPKVGVFLEFEIIDNQGNKYILGGDGFVEKSKTQALGQSANKLEYTSAWFLKQIVTRSNEIVDFTYEDEIINYILSVSSNIIVSNGCADDFDKEDGLETGWSMTDLRDVVDMYAQSKRLKKIKSSNTTVEFLYSINREDNIAGTAKLLTGIKATNNKNDVIIDYSLLYDTHGYLKDHRMADWYRLDSRLKEYRHFLKQIKNNLIANYSYSFLYKNPASLISRFSFNQDRDGYPLNNIDNYYPYPAEIQKSDIIGFANQVGAGRYFTANIEPSKDFYAIGNLIEIKSPTKGISKIEYEPHYSTTKVMKTFSNSSYEQVNKRCSDNARDAVKTITIEILPNAEPYLELWTDGKVDYEDCRARDSHGNVISHSGYDFHDQLGVSIKDLTTGELIYSDSKHVDDGLTKTKESCSLGQGQFCPVGVVPGRKYELMFTTSSALHTVYGSYNLKYNEREELTPITDYILAGGSRIKKITDYDFTNALEGEKIFYYNTVDKIASKETSSQKRWNKEYLSKVKTYPLCIIQSDTYPGTVPFIRFRMVQKKKNRNRYTISDNSIVNDYLNRGNQIYYSSISEKITDIGILEKKYKITTDERPYGVVDEPLPNVSLSVTDGDSYLLLSEKQFQEYGNGQFKLVKSKENKYTSINTATKLTSFVVRKNYSAGESGGLNIEWKFDLDPFSITSYYNTMSYNLLSGEEVKIYDNATSNYNGVKTKRNFYKDNIIKEETSFYNEQKNIVTDYLYAFEKQDQFLINKNIVSEPLEIRKSVSNQLYETTKIDYKGYSFPKEVISTGQSNVVNNITKLNYDENFGNIQQIENHDGTKTVYLYGYNKSLLIAKIENTSQEEVAIALGVSVVNLNTIDETKLTQINNLRNNDSLKDAQITTYEHKPLVGVTKITDPKGVHITYEYDKANRLDVIKDKDGNILNKYEYNYKNN